MSPPATHHVKVKVTTLKTCGMPEISSGSLDLTGLTEEPNIQNLLERLEELSLETGAEGSSGLGLSCCGGDRIYQINTIQYST